MTCPSKAVAKEPVKGGGRHDRVKCGRGRSGGPARGRAPPRRAAGSALPDRQGRRWTGGRRSTGRRSAGTARAAATGDRRTTESAGARRRPEDRRASAAERARSTVDGCEEDRPSRPGIRWEEPRSSNRSRGSDRGSRFQRRRACRRGQAFLRSRGWRQKLDQAYRPGERPCRGAIALLRPEAAVRGAKCPTRAGRHARRAGSVGRRKRRRRRANGPSAAHGVPVPPEHRDTEQTASSTLDEAARRSARRIELSARNAACR
ncbi:hypothetical protein FHR81_005228 [Actinoalloteichus hoggarensis]|uniref:Uncharacterized protein n=1 Tax=Actinoalloteichus hoggarensis TaxID=1470176 RepID=A0A221WAU5_9PSEU|nr:hypothetical protein AHOG_25505 [Actinoalloteichus hoggarensis]MBB5924151.1 hypothetical protein [Actinoalloteichus hoggarensis]